MNDRHRVALSKTMSLLLRHKPEAGGLQLDGQGWCTVDALLAALARLGKAAERTDNEAVVAACEKQRFALDGDRIRANQGHSIAVELQLEAAEPPALLYHGTVARFLDRIRVEGLRRMQRHHVHLSAGRETAAAVGSRRGSAIVLQIDAAAMAADGHRFFRSENGVWLCDAVPPQYIVAWGEDA